MKSAIVVTLLVVSLGAGAAGPAAAAKPDVDWVRTYGISGDNAGLWIEECSTAGYVVSGMWTEGAAPVTRALLMRLYADGDTVWTRTYGNNLYQSAVCVRETADRGFILAGYIQKSPGETDAWFIRTDANGDTLWTSEFDFGSSDLLYCVVPMPGDEFIACGLSNGIPPADSIDLLVMKINGSGRGEWKLILDRPANERGIEICRTTDGNVAICGLADSGGDEDIFLAKVDALTGDTLWTREYEDPTESDICSGIQETPDGGLIVCGGETDYATLVRRGFLMKTDAGGDSIWTRKYGGPGDEMYFSSVVVAPDLGYAMGSRRDTSTVGNYDFHFVRTDAEGDTLWTKAVPEKNRQVLTCMTMTSDYGYVSCGEGRVLPAQDRTVWLVKLKEDDAGAPVGVNEPLAVRLALDGASPFMSEVAIRYEIARAADVNLSVYDIEGRHVAALARGARAAGTYRAAWDITNAGGERMPPGVYFIRCVAGGNSAVLKAPVLR